MCEETIASWNEWASLYSEKFMNVSLYHSSYDAFLQLLASSNTNGDVISLLDIGCGPGIIAKYVFESLDKHQLPGVTFHGIDAAPNMIEQARKFFPQGVWHVMHTRDLKNHFRTEQFNGIFVGFCIPYIALQEIDALCADLSYLLPTSGLLYISFVIGDSSLSGWKSNKKNQRVMFYYYEENTIKECLDRAGFGIVHTLYVSFPRPSEEKDEQHCILIARKI